jgi:tyrosinase
VPRRPIAVFQSQYPDAFNLFILALESLQAKDESKDTSYYQISGKLVPCDFRCTYYNGLFCCDLGIHGFPFIPWQYPASATVNPGMGYCTHGSVIFTTWHRPYLLLLEQLLYREAVAISKKFTGSAGQKYQAAVENVRFP